MIESKYWKDDLLAFAKYLRKNNHFKRWSEKAQVNFEKQIVIHFFLIRKLIECDKFSTKLAYKKYRIKKYQKSDKFMHSFNAWNLDKQYEMDNDLMDNMNVNFISNQLIHSLTLQAFRNGKKWESIMMTSDYQKNEWLYQITVETIAEIMDEFGSNYPSRMQVIFDDANGDCKITSE